MKNSISRISLFLSALLLLSLPAEAADSNFGGKWLWKTKGASFELDIIQTGTRIRGAHYAAVDNGRRCDNQEHPDETGPSFVGTAVGNKALVEITSSYSNTSGKATMILEKGKLRWLLDKKPSGEYYFPDTAMLLKQKGPAAEVAEHQTPEVEAMDLSAKARDSEEKGELQNAMTLIERAIKLDPKDWSNYSTQGDLLRKLNNYDTAIGAYNKAIELCPQDMTCLIKPDRAHCYLMIKNTDLAIKDLTDAIDQLTEKIGLNDSIKTYLAKSYRSRAEAYDALGKSDLASTDKAQADKFSR